MKIVLTLLFYMLFSIGGKGQTNTTIVEEEFDFYLSNSDELKSIMSTLLDTCKSEFNCEGVRNLSLYYSTQYQDNGEIFIHAFQIIESDDMRRYKENGFIVLQVDTIYILIREELLKRTSFSDSVTFIGTKNFSVEYDDFANCLNRKEMTFTMIFTSLPNLPMEIIYFNHYTFNYGKDKSKKNRKWLIWNRKSE